MLAQFGWHDVAVELLSRAVTAQPATAQLHDQLGQILHQKGDLAEAVSSYERALAIEPALSGVVARLAGAHHDLALSRDSDYAETSGRPWKADASAWEEKQGRETIVVSFAGLGVGRSPPTFIFRHFLARYEHIDRLFLRDLSAHWYLRGLPGLSSDVESTAQYIESQTRGYRRRVFLGCSSGALAALLYGERLGVEKILAFSPQTTLGLSKTTELRDYRWESRLARMRADPEFPGCADLAALNPLQAAADIYYPGGSQLDCAHAERLHGAATRKFPQPGGNHLIALQMRDNGTLRPVIEREIPE